MNVFFQMLSVEIQFQNSLQKVLENIFKKQINDMF